ncbi:SGNH/GDSL hydrolase family protein [Tropicibacter naphthalenivorans]|uniref:SGNH hydrolase-type esterase domain-containing protein n=1 Tax=Tropicibacter naphthalenivorans TaxID=441103 RepID=A0A0N7LZH0_9RHOB|nr:SGNH/GDSL hydrolase family protein [Tropicibacter naphthalenivorans]CUH77641.1 hypothetical protein TRN7648_01581 [Tropicibacter naphthalenivorans]SMC54766.1 Lysophospholipase L1 [Tropicibacter naphthalenivorans]
MAVILCYGDSNTHGTLPMKIPGVSDRAPRGDRWTDVMAALLGPDHQVIPEGLPGRTTVHDDHIEGGARNGLSVLPAVIHSHKPLDFMVLMIGTNDLKPRFSVTANEIARSVERLILTARAEGEVSDILVVAPAPVREVGTLREVFAGAEARQEGLDDQIRAVAERHGCGFLAAGDHVKVSDKDGVHWEVDQQRHFGAIMARAVLDHLK